MGGLFNLAILSAIPQMATGLNLRLFYYVFSNPAIFSVLFTFFSSPETYYMRPAIAVNGHILIQSATDKIRIYED